MHLRQDNYLCQEGYVFSTVCQHDYGKTTGPILLKLGYLNQQIIFHFRLHRKTGPLALAEV